MKCDVCPYLEKFERTITQSKHWKVDINENQEYLGRCYVALKRHCSSLSDVKQEEWLDFAVLIKKLEKAFKDAFGAKLINWTCLMNAAYFEKPHNPHVHWHVRPRYEKDVEFAREKFIDPEFGHHYARTADRIKILPEDKLQKIIKELQKNL